MQQTQHRVETINGQQTERRKARQLVLNKPSESLHLNELCDNQQDRYKGYTIGEKQIIIKITSKMLSRVVPRAGLRADAGLRYNLNVRLLYKRAELYVQSVDMQYKG
jgi:hypothetical protein